MTTLVALASFAGIVLLIVEIWLAFRKNATIKKSIPEKPICSQCNQAIQHHDMLAISKKGEANLSYE